MQDAKEIRLVFRACGGSVDLPAITAVCGDRIGAMPKPVRRGYTFVGWFTSPGEDTSGQKVSPETVVEGILAEEEERILYARWEKTSGAGGKGKKSSLAKQKGAIWALVVLALLLVVGVVVTQIIIDIYHYTDLDGTVYTIKKSDKEYKLFYKDGSLCDVNDDGYYLTALGTQLSLNKKTGEYSIYAVVATEGTEQVGFSQRVLMFKQLTYDMSSTKDLTRVIERIEVHNQHGTMTLRRGSTTGNRFVIDGHEDTLFSEELFAQLSNGCGYTISMQRLENPARLPDGSIDYAEYGLSPAVREQLDEKGQVVLDDDGNPVSYDYVPTWYRVTTMQPDRTTGLDAYKVTVGDATVSGAGYYARYEDRDTVYILGATNFDAAVLQPIETFVTPMIVYPMSLNSYFDVENFTLRGDIDYDRMNLYMLAKVAGLELEQVVNATAGSLSDEDIQKLKDAAEAIQAMTPEKFVSLYTEAQNACSRIITSFSFVDLASREGTLYASTPYTMATSYMAGYLPNSNNLSAVLQNLYSMSFDGVISLGPSEEELDRCGLATPAFVISFIYHEPYTDDNGQTAYHDRYNSVAISQKTEDGVYYAYADDYDMIVAFDESQAPYLEWETMDWYEREYYQYNIAFLQKLKMEGTAIRALGSSYLDENGAIVFDLDNSRTYDVTGSGKDQKLTCYWPCTLTFTVEDPAHVIPTANTTVFNSALESLQTLLLRELIVAYPEAFSNEDCPFLLDATFSGSPASGTGATSISLKVKLSDRRGDNPTKAAEMVRKAMEPLTQQLGLTLSDTPVMGDVTINSDQLKVYLNGTFQNYPITITRPSGTREEVTATYNFRRLIQSMLTASVEGVADLSEEQINAFKNTPDDQCQLKLTVLLDDCMGHTSYLVYRFYQYSERRSFMTVEVLDSPDAPSSPQNGQGMFYVLRSFCDKLATDAARFADQVEIFSDSKN